MLVFLSALSPSSLNGHGESRALTSEPLLLTVLAGWCDISPLLAGKLEIEQGAESRRQTAGHCVEMLRRAHRTPL